MREESQMKMDIIRDGYDSWNIMLGEKVIGRIETFHRFKGTIKNLYVNDRNIGSVKNQAEAKEKLMGFFIVNKMKIKEVEILINELEYGITQVRDEICKLALNKEKAEQIKLLEEYKSLDLI